MSHRSPTLARGQIVGADVQDVSDLEIEVDPREVDRVIVDATHHNTSPVSFLCTITERRRCRSIPTYCRSIGASSVRGLLVRSPDLLGIPRGAEAPLRHRFTSKVPDRRRLQRRWRSAL